MADKKISQLTELTTAADDDSLVILDTDADVTKRIEVSNLVGTNSLLLKTAGTLSSSPQAVQSVGAQVSALQISSVGVKAAGTLTATGTSTLASATLSGDLTIGTGETVDTILDEDNLGSDDPNALATQQSIKAYVDTQITTEDTLEELNDVDISGKASGDVIIYQGDTWDNKQISGDASMDSAGAVVVDGLQGRSVASTAPSDGESLAWDSGTSAWKPSAAGSGTVTSVTITGSDGIEVDSGSPITSAGTIALGLASVDATKIADGSVSDTEFQYIGGLTSDAQTQIDAKGAGTLTAVTGTTPVNSSGGTTPAISIDNATTSATGAASFSSDNFSVTAGAVSIKDNGVAVDELADIARGSIIYGNASAATAELTKGVGDSILTSDGTDLSWATSYTGNVTGNLTGNADTVTTNANLTGEVTSVGNAAEIADDVVDEANLKVSNAPTNGYVLSAQSGDTGGLTWVDNTHAAGTVTSVTAGDGMTQSGTSTINPTLDVVGTADRITANANDIDIASTYVGQTSITTLGTVATGTWGTGSVIAGTTMTLGSDGTGDVYYRNASGILTRLGNAGGGDDDKVLTLASGLPSWAAAGGGSGTVTEVTVGTGLDVADGTTTPDITLSLDELTDDTGTSSLGWTSGDFLAIVEAGGTAKRLMPPAEIGIAVSDETTALTTSSVATIMIPRKMVLTEVKASLTTKDASNTMYVDVLYSATDPSSTSSILDASLNFCEITSDTYKGETTAFTGLASSYSLAEDSFVRIEIESTSMLSDQKGLKVWLLGYWE